MAVLDDVGTCKGVLSMIDKSPCVDGKKMPNSYVHLGPKMNKTITKYSELQ